MTCLNTLKGSGEDEKFVKELLVTVTKRLHQAHDEYDYNKKNIVNLST